MEKLDLHPADKTPFDTRYSKQKRWDAKFLRICNELASWSSCLSRQVGAILVRDYTIIATGYNGPPRGIPHCGEDRGVLDFELFYEIRYARDNDTLTGDSTMCPRQRLGYKSGGGLYLCPAAHAEDNCISNAARTGVETLGSTMYMNCGIPCQDCMKKIINAGVEQLVCVHEELYDKMSKFLLENSNLIVRTYVN